MDLLEITVQSALGSSRGQWADMIGSINRRTVHMHGNTYGQGSLLVIGVTVTINPENPETVICRYTFQEGKFCLREYPCLSADELKMLGAQFDEAEARYDDVMSLLRDLKGEVAGLREEIRSAASQNSSAWQD